MADQGCCRKSGIFLEIDPEAGRIEAIRIAASSEQDEAAVLDQFANICKPGCWKLI
jgi:hypothetical protein